jgi:hypothetical protein
MMTNANSLPAEPIVQRAADAERIPFSPTNDFRAIFAGAPGLPDFFEERSARGDGPPLHRHPWAAWELVVEGTIRVVIAEQEFRLGPGDAVYIPPGAPHAYIVESDQARVVGVNLSDGRFPSLQRQAAPLMAAPGGPDMQRIMELAKAHDVEILGPPLAAGAQR